MRRWYQASRRGQWPFEEYYRLRYFYGDLWTVPRLPAL